MVNKLTGAHTVLMLLSTAQAGHADDRQALTGRDDGDQANAFGRHSIGTPLHESYVSTWGTYQRFISVAGTIVATAWPSPTLHTAAKAPDHSTWEALLRLHLS